MKTVAKVFIAVFPFDRGEWKGREGERISLMWFGIFQGPLIELTQKGAHFCVSVRAPVWGIGPRRRCRTLALRAR